MKIPRESIWKSTGISLGGGGQSQVHLVVKKDEPDGEQYALKVLSNRGSEQARERFQQEIEVIKGIDHPSIIRVFDHSEKNDDFQYYVMEYHEGAVSLEDVITSKPTNPYHGDVLQSLGLFEKILLAIQAYETSPTEIVHRDINPKNILVLSDHSIRLIDFGICHIENGTTITLTGENFGTGNYTPPECRFGSDSRMGIHSDIYSASKVLWSSITSVSAFDREQPVFNNCSMNSMFEEKPETWHLTHIFEKTIRERPEDRLTSTDKVLEQVQEVRRVVQGGFPPLEEVRTHCPSCGWNRIADFQQGYIVFGNPNPHRVVSLICSLCGFGFVRDMGKLEDSLEEKKNLS